VKQLANAMLVVAMLMAGCSHENAAGKNDDPSLGGRRAGQWQRAEGEREGKPLIWEMRAGYVVTAARPQLLNVSWHYVTDRVDGQAEDGLKLRFAALETKLVTALGAHADLVATLDYYGQHDWYWYADSAEVLQTARSVIATESWPQIAVSVEPDEKGEFYGALVAKVR
jgi:hypothetical protein